MELFDITAILITLSALFGYVNYRFFKLPNTIGLMLISILMSLSVFFLNRVSTGFGAHWMKLVMSIDFNKTFMVGMLSFLLFAGTLHVNAIELLKNKWEIGIYATAGIIISTGLIGVSMYYVLGLLGLQIKPIYCLLFGALISPTDPIAVLGILRNSGVPRSIEAQLSGESLFNDGIGVVVFVVLMGIATGEYEASFSGILQLFAEEAGGGIILGLLLGWIAYAVLKSIDNYKTEILVTLSIVTGGYALALTMGISGPLAMVVAGMLIGGRGRKFAMSEKTRMNLDMFWELVDEILNSILFVLIGLQLLVVVISMHFVMAGLIAIPVSLLARFISIGIPLRLLTIRKRFSWQKLKIMTWGGLRGGIAVALSLSLPVGPERDIIITMTYLVVVFSILIQGLTIGRLVLPAMNGRTMHN